MCSSVSQQPIFYKECHIHRLEYLLWCIIKLKNVENMYITSKSQQVLWNGYAMRWIYFGLAATVIICRY